MESGRPELKALLTRVVLERERVIAPFVVAASLGTLLVSNFSNIPTPSTVIFVNIGVILLHSTLAIVLHLRRMPDRFAHPVGVALWWGPVSATLTSQYLTHSPLLTLVFLVEITTVILLVHTWSIIVSYVIADGIWIWLCLREAAADAPARIGAVLMAQAFAILLHVVMKRSLLNAEIHRLAEVATAEELSRQLAELRRSEAERTVLHEQLLHAQRMEAVGTLAAGVAHDMNNVLASIMTVSGILHADAVDARVKHDLAQIVDDAERGAELTRGLLAFSRRGQYRKQVITIGEVIANVLPILERTLPKSVKILDTLACASTCIEGDPTQLGHALVNLCINAADAMAGKGTLLIGADTVFLDGSGAVAVGLAVGNYVRLRVTDTGVGMDEATRRRVFEPFFTTKARGKGTGLGLSIVYGIAQGHAGTASVSSEVGKGTTFWIHLPIVNSTPVKQAPVRGSDRIRRRGTVLVIDDEPGVRRGHARILERMGLMVLTAEDGASGLALFEANIDVIGLVILDMGMPVMAGGECFRRLRELRKVPILIATGYAIDAEVQTLVDQGAVVLEKPFSVAKLGEEAARLLSSSPSFDPSEKG